MYEVLLNSLCNLCCAFLNHIVICLWEIYFCQSVRLTLAITLVSKLPQKALIVF